MSTPIRIVPPSPSQLAASPDAPAIFFIEASSQRRDRLAIATSQLGLGLDLRGPMIRIIASREDLGRIALVLCSVDDELAAALQDYLHPVAAWRLRTKKLPLERPHIMGIINLTEDSFSGDGVGGNIDDALRRAEELRAAGASIIDVGAESARADRPVMDESSEAKLAATAVMALVREGHCVSFDTYKPGVARTALEAGAELVNDISGLTLGIGTALEAVDAGAGYVLNYSFSVPKQRPSTRPVYDDVVAETVTWMASRIEQLTSAGMSRDRLAIDPGIAFGKSHDEDIEVLRRIGELTTFGLPVLLAHSRKNFIGSINGQPPTDRDIETFVLSALAYEQGVRIFRVHDVEGTSRAVEMAAALVTSRIGDFAPDGESWPWRAGTLATHMTRGAAEADVPTGQRW